MIGMVVSVLVVSFAILLVWVVIEERRARDAYVWAAVEAAPAAMLPFVPDSGEHAISRTTDPPRVWADRASVQEAGHAVSLSERLRVRKPDA